MKKFIYSIAALAAIVVMGSCSQDSDLTSVKSSSSKIDSVTVGLNINTGIEVSESSSNMGKSTANSANTSLTRAGETTVTTPANFSVDLSNYQYTAYFVAAEKTDEYVKGALVRKVTVKSGDNPISVPAMKYNIYVTNYDPTTTINAATGADQEQSIEDLESQLPESSTSTLYLFGSQLGADFSATTATTNHKATVTLTNHYAAVCIAANDFVKSVTYKATTTNDSRTFVTDYVTNQSWYYMYINTQVTQIPNSIIALQKIQGLESYDLNKKFDKASHPLTADNVYQFTVSDDYTGGGQGGAILTLNTTVFTQTNSNDLNVY